MLSPADMLIIGAAALLFFGPDQLPKVARRAGQVVREVQATSQSFIREMERAADESDLHAAEAAYARRAAEQPTAPELEWDAPIKPDPPEPPGDVIKPPDPPV